MPLCKTPRRQIYQCRQSKERSPNLKLNLSPGLNHSHNHTNHQFCSRKLRPSPIPYQDGGRRRRTEVSKALQPLAQSQDTSIPAREQPESHSEVTPNLNLDEHRALRQEPNGPPHNNTQDAGEEDDDHPIHLRPESRSLSQVAPNPNSNELRESPLEANTSTNMQEVGLYGVGDEEEDHANGSDHHSPSPFPFSNPTPESPEFTSAQHKNNGWSTRSAACKSKQTQSTQKHKCIYFDKTQADIYTMFWERQMEREKRQSERDADYC